MDLHPSEAELIKAIRERFRFGTIEVLTKDGLPVSILKTVERYNLSTITGPVHL
jgi:hypothetical protein